MEILAMGVTFLKALVGFSVFGLMATMALDKDIHKLIKKVGKKMIHKKDCFDIGNEHAVIIGLTQYGKTYGTIKTMEKMDKPVLLFNSQHTPVGDKWIEADGGNTVEQIIYSLKKGYKVNFLPSDDSLEKMSIQLAAITEEIYKLGRFDFYFAVDEVHLFKLAKNKKGHEALIRLATTGLGRGFKMIFLSQRGAMVDNTLYTQSTKHIIFALGIADYAYLKNLGFPSSEIHEKVNGEKYIFVEYDQKEVKGPFKIE